MADRRKHFVAVRLKRHQSQVEAGALGIFGCKPVIRRTFATNEIARRLRTELACVVGDQGAVDAATEQGCYRQAFRQPQPHGLAQQTIEHARVMAHRNVDTRVDRRLEARAVLARKRITGRQQQHVARRHGLEQRPHLRAEQKSLAGLNDVKRLDAEWIAGGEKFTIRQVERDKRIHANEALECAVTPYLQRIRQNLGIGFCFELDAESGKFLAQFAVVVDLAIEGNRETSVERNLRLDGVLGVDNAQPPRRHRGIFPGGYDGVGHIAAMQNALD